MSAVVVAFLGIAAIFGLIFLLLWAFTGWRLGASLAAAGTLCLGAVVGAIVSETLT